MNKIERQKSLKAWRNFSKPMKTKRIFAVVKYNPDIVRYEPFRFKGKWWRRTSGVLNQAIELVSKKPSNMEEDYLVAVPFSSIPKRFDYLILGKVSV